MPTVSRGRALAYLAVVVCLLALGGRFLVAGARPGNAGTPAEALVALEADPAPSGTTEEEDMLVVHVVGAVRRPGLYRLAAGSRVDDAIRKAGGSKPKAALELVNLAALVSDGQQVVVPVRGAGPAPGASAAGAPSGPVHLNTATLEELDALPGVGPVTAQKILDYRTKHGSFSTVDELDAIPGIGPARLEQLRELVVP